MTDEEWSDGLARFAHMSANEQCAFLFALVAEVGRHLDDLAGAPADVAHWSSERQRAFEDSQFWWGRARIALQLYEDAERERTA